MSRILRTLLAPLALVAAPCLAVQITIPDACGTTAIANSASTAVAANGDLTVSGAAGAYTPLFGCDAAVPTNPVCSLSASKTSLVPGTGPASTTTLFSKCTSSPTSYGWNKPPAGPDLPAGAGKTFDLSFTAPGLYTYSLTAANASGAGPISNQVTIVVADPAKPPLCALTASPAAVYQGQMFRLQSSCGGAPTSYSWSVDNGGPLPASGSAGADLATNATGTFTYRVQGVNAAGTGTQAAAAVTVSTGFTASGAFNPSSIMTGQTSVLTLTLTNPGPFALTGVQFSATYPAGLTNSTAAATTCASGTVTGAVGASTLALSGATIAAAGSCTVTVTLVAPGTGNYQVTSGPVNSANAGSASPAIASLVVSTPLVASVSFTPPIATANTVSRMKVQVNNNASIAATGMAYTVTYPAGLATYARPNVTNTCGGTVTAVANATTFSISGASIAAGGSCALNIDTLAPAVGEFTVTIPGGGVTSTNGLVNNAPASAMLETVSCTFVATAFDMGTIAPDSESGGSLLSMGEVEAHKFRVDSSGTTVVFSELPRMYYGNGNQTWYVSRCKGDTTPTGSCKRIDPATLTVKSFASSSCTVTPGKDYYLNVKQNNNCTGDYTPYCGFIIKRDDN